MDKFFDGDLFRFGTRRMSTSERKESAGRSPVVKESSGANPFFSVFDRISSGPQKSNSQSPNESGSLKDEHSDWTEIQLTEVTSASSKVDRSSRVLQDDTITINTIPHHHKLVEGGRLSGSVDGFDNEVQSGEQNVVHVDEYGFPLNSDEAAMREKAQEAELIRVKKQRIVWAQYIQGVEFDSKKIKKTESLRKMVRSGIPTELRGQLWQVFSVISAYRERFPVRYEEIWVTFEHEELNHAAQIEKDLARTFPGHKILNSPELIFFLRRILCSYAWVKPDVGYCQSMNFIAATLLLFMSEEEAFWMLGNIIETILPPDFYSSNLFGVQVENKILLGLIHQKLPKVHEHLDTLKVSIEPVTLQWLMCLFLNTLPFETCMRIWDILFFDGSKILLRISLGILKILEKKILSSQTPAEIISILKDEPKKLFDVEHLFKVSWSKFWCGSLSGASIQQMRADYEKVLEQELLELSERRRIYHEMKSRREKKESISDQADVSDGANRHTTQAADRNYEMSGSDDDVYYEAEEYLSSEEYKVPKCFEDEESDAKENYLQHEVDYGERIQRPQYKDLFADEIEKKIEVNETQTPHIKKRGITIENTSNQAQRIGIHSDPVVHGESSSSPKTNTTQSDIGSRQSVQPSVDKSPSMISKGEPTRKIDIIDITKNEADRETAPATPTYRKRGESGTPHFLNANPSWKGSRADLIGIFQQPSIKMQSNSPQRAVEKDGAFSLSSVHQAREEQEQSSDDADDASNPNSPQVEFLRRTSFGTYSTEIRDPLGSNERWIEAHLQLQNDLHRQGFQQVLRHTQTTSEEEGANVIGKVAPPPTATAIEDSKRLPATHLEANEKIEKKQSD